MPRVAFEDVAFIWRRKKKKPLLCKGFFESNVPGEIRTPDRRLRRPLLYPAELLGHSIKIIFDFADTFSVSTATPLSVSPFKKRLEWCADVTSMMQIRSCSIQLSYWDMVSKVIFWLTVITCFFCRPALSMLTQDAARAVR
jgi:hypothetical protein